MFVTQEYRLVANSGPRAFQKAHFVSRNSKLLRRLKEAEQPRRHPPPEGTLARPLLLPKEMHRSTCSKQPHRLVRIVGALVVLAQVALEEPPPRSRTIVLISCVTTRNFSNCDRSYNSSLTCSNLSCSKSMLAIPSWPR